MQEFIAEIHDYWFGPLAANGLCQDDRNKLWFQSSPEGDEQCRRRFGQAVEQALAGKLDSWAETDQGLVALVLLLDQFTRNIYRDTPRAFAGDSRALQAAKDAIETKRWHQLPAIHRVFILLPLEHSEVLTDQHQCLALFKQLNEEVDHPQITGLVRYAQAHLDVILKFGRFPHRNVILGRQSTESEEQHLAKHGGF